MMQNKYENVSLDLLIEKADLVAIVSAQDTYVEFENISILPPGSEFTGKNEPPYFYPLYHDENPQDQLNRNYLPYSSPKMMVNVNEVLFDSSGEVTPGEGLTYHGADSGLLLELHRKYHLEGKRRPALLKNYRSSDQNFSPIFCDQFIVFLIKTTTGWEEVVGNAAESMKSLDDVNKLLRFKSVRYTGENRQEAINFVDDVLAYHGDLGAAGNFQSGLEIIGKDYQIFIEDIPSPDEFDDDDCGPDGWVEESGDYEITLVANSTGNEITFLINKVTKKISNVFRANG